MNVLTVAALWLIGIPLAFAAIVSLVQASGVLLDGLQAALR